MSTYRNATNRKIPSWMSSVVSVVYDIVSMTTIALRMSFLNKQKPEVK